MTLTCDSLQSSVAAQDRPTPSFHPFRPAPLEMADAVLRIRHPSCCAVKAVLVALGVAVSLAVSACSRPGDDAGRPSLRLGGNLHDSGRVHILQLSVSPNRAASGTVQARELESDLDLLPARHVPPTSVLVGSVAELEDLSIAVLDRVRRKVLVFSRKGAFIRSWEVGVHEEFPGMLPIAMIRVGDHFVVWNDDTAATFLSYDTLVS
jgi:hypothetical protein